MTKLDTPDTLNFTFSGDAVSLDAIPVGTRCRIVAVDENCESLLRLMEMGLIPGTEATLERAAWLKSPYSVRLSGCTLAIRREDAARVMVVPIPAEPAEGNQS